MVAGTALVLGVVALGAALNLAAPTGEHRGVHIQCDGAQLEFVKEPSVAAGLHPGGSGLIKALEQAHDGLVSGGLAPVKQAYQGGIQPRDISVDESGCPAPDADDHLFNELLWAVSPVGTGLG